MVSTQLLVHDCGVTCTVSEFRTRNKRRRDGVMCCSLLVSLLVGCFRLQGCRTATSTGLALQLTRQAVVGMSVSFVLVTVDPWVPPLYLEQSPV